MSIISDLFGRRKATIRTTVYTNPWAGLSSYEDPATSAVKRKFCGRDNETYDVARLIDDNFFLTLYGKSGIGKTSLLNAGVFPALRRELYTPLSIRLGMTEAEVSFQHSITTAIERTIKAKGGENAVRTLPVVDEQTDLTATDYLWNYFARHRFLTANGLTTFPVIVFDQFEEVFRHRRPEAETLLRQLNYLIDESHALNDCLVQGEPYTYDFNFRFVVSIREDDLYRLEDSLDNNYLPELKRCRFRLRSLSEEGARDVIHIPGKELFEESQLHLIEKELIKLSKNKEDDTISTNSLSLICSRLYIAYKSHQSDKITLDFINRFITSNPFESFYLEATKKLAEREKRYIENNFVDSSGRRNSVSEADFTNKMPNGPSLLGGDFKIFQSVSASSDSTNNRIELIHDSFCATIIKQKALRVRNTTEHFALFIVYVIILLLGTQLIPFSYMERESWLSITMLTPLSFPFILPIVTIGIIRGCVPIKTAIIGSLISLLPLITRNSSLTSEVIGSYFFQRGYVFWGYSDLFICITSIVLAGFFLFSILYQKIRLDRKKNREIFVDNVNYSYKDLFISSTNRIWLFLIIIILTVISCLKWLPTTINPQDNFLLVSLALFTLFDYKNTTSIWIITGWNFAGTLCSYTYVSISNPQIQLYVAFGYILFIVPFLLSILRAISDIMGWKNSGNRAFMLYMIIMYLYRLPVSDFSFETFSRALLSYSPPPLSVYNYLFIIALIGIYVFRYSKIKETKRVFFTYSVLTFFVYLFMLYTRK